MNRREFMTQLERLLSDIPEKDRKEALEFYENYFDDAGVENEGAVMSELGTPEKVAVEIKTGLDSDREYGEYTDTGYRDPRFDTRNDIRKRDEKRNSKEQSKQRRLLLFLVIGILTFPVWGALLGAAGALILGIGGTLFGIIIGSLVSSLGFLIGGAALIAAGIAQMASSAGLGIAVLGAGLIGIAFGIAAALIFVWLTFKAIPALIRWIGKKVPDLIHSVKGA